MGDCTSAIERYVWSGDQLLYEIRAQGGDNASTSQLESDAASGGEFGRVGYTHAAGIDAPLSVIRTGYVSGNITIVPHSDYRGAYHAGSTSTGAAYNCGPSDPCLYIVWPKKYWGGYYDGGDPAAGDWAGSLIRGQQDISGLMYRRNRYYDPQTGQFTQSDPIGTAGGLNAYGFAAGDPMSYSDPYGLKVQCVNEESCDLWNELIRLARDGMKSNDAGVRQSATQLNQMLRDVWDSEMILSIDVSTRAGIMNMYWGGASTHSSRRIVGIGQDDRILFGTTEIRIDPTYANRRFGISNTITLAHEIGHAWTHMTYRGESNPNAIRAENLAREISGCNVMRYRHSAIPPCRGQ